MLFAVKAGLAQASPAYFIVLRQIGWDGID
jgi:hypothetical protein